MRKGRAVLLSEEFAAKEPEVAELVAAHELSRALDVGQSDDAERVAPPFADDRAALVALRAGVAAKLEQEYASEHLGRDASGDSFVEISRDARDDPATPQLTQTMTTLPPEAGRAYVSRLHERGGWKAVDEALSDPPTTTAAILHPDAADDQTEAAPTFAVRPVLQKGWAKVATADVGELDTIALLRTGLGEEAAREAAAGWRSGRFETWVKGKETDAVLPAAVPRQERLGRRLAARRRRRVARVRPRDARRDHRGHRGEARGRPRLRDRRRRRGAGARGALRGADLRAGRAHRGQPGRDRAPAVGARRGGMPPAGSLRPAPPRTARSERALNGSVPFCSVTPSNASLCACM